MKINFKDFFQRLPWMTVLKVGAVVLVLGLGVQTCRAHRANKALVADQVRVNLAEKATKDAQAHDALMVKAKKKADDAATKVDKESKAAIALANAKAEAEHAVNIALKAKITTLTGDQLATQIGARINIPGGPPEIAAVVAGGFSLTRPGGERTYSIFLDGEQAVRDVKTKDGIIVQMTKNDVSKDNAKGECDALVKSKDGVIEKMGKEIGQKDTQIHDLKLSRTWKFITYGLGGTVLGGIIVEGLHLLGVIK